MIRHFTRASAAAALLLAANPLSAHTIVGNRVFPADAHDRRSRRQRRTGAAGILLPAGDKPRRHTGHDLLFAGMGIRQDDHTRFRHFHRLGWLYLAAQSAGRRLVEHRNRSEVRLLSGPRAMSSSCRQRIGRDRYTRKPAKRVAPLRSLLDDHAEILHRQRLRRCLGGLGATLRRDRRGRLFDPDRDDQSDGSYNPTMLHLWRIVAIQPALRELLRASTAGGLQPADPGVRGHFQHPPRQPGVR